MTGKIVGWAFQQKCPAASKLVLARLADAARANDAYCWLSVPRMSRDTGLAPRTIRKHLDLLQKQGLIKIERRTRGKRQTSNGYRLAYFQPVSDAQKQTTQRQGQAALESALPGTACIPNITPILPPNNLPLPSDGTQPRMNPRFICLRNKIGANQFQAWFGNADIVSDNPPIIVLQSRFFAREVGNRYRKTLQDIFGSDVCLYTKDEWGTMK